MRGNILVLNMATHIPDSTRGLRACMNCRLVKADYQFIESGCENCEKYLNLKNRRESLKDYTSDKFSGLLAVIKPSESWVRKWKKMDEDCVPGLYALSVVGVPTRAVENKLNMRH